MMHLLVVTAFLLLAAQTPAAAQAPASPPMTLAAKFEQYCRQSDSNSWFCDRNPLLSSAQQWHVLNGYCAHPAPTVRPRKPNTTSDDGNPSITPQALCEGLGAVTPLMLVYDHRLQQWDRDGRFLFSRHRRGFDVDEATEVVTAFLKTGDPVGIVVTHSNPLLYTALRGGAKEETADQFEAIPQLLSALGTFVGLGFTDMSLVIRSSVDSRTFGDVRPFSSSSGDPMPLPSSAYSRDVALLADANRTISQGGALAKERLEAFTALRAHLQLLVQQLEHGPTEFRGSFSPALEQPGAWSEAFASLGVALGQAPAYSACLAVTEAFDPVVTTEKATEVHAAAIGYLRLADGREGDDPDDPTKPRRCRFESTFELLEPVRLISDLARQLALDPNARTSNGWPVIDELRERQTQLRDAQLRPMQSLAALVRQATARRDAAEQVLKKDEEIRKASTALSVMATRTRDAAFRKTPEGQLVVSDLLFVKDEIYSAGYNKVRVTPLVISIASPYSDQVTPLRPKESTTSYRLARYGADRFSVTVGPIYTGVSSPSYTAIDPDPKSNTGVSTVTKTGADPGPVVTKTVTEPELKQIAERDRDPRSGAFAVFANYRLAGTAALGVGGQFGVGLSKDFPSFHYGASFNVSKWVNVGVGCGMFRVKTLGERNGVTQTLGQEVGSADDIKLTTTWVRKCIKGDAYYGMVSVNVLGLPLFSGK